ncbi:MAG: DUF4185 domain-containing protein [Clostridia bacterium]
MKKILATILLLVMLFFTVSCSINDNTGDNGDFEDNIEWQAPEGAVVNSESPLVWYVNYVRRVTGAKSSKPNDKTSPLVSTTQYGLGSTDLGVPFYDSANKRLHFAFGDSFSGAKMSGVWNNNIVMYTDDLDFSKGINWKGSLNGKQTQANGSNSEFWRQITPDVQNAQNITDGIVSDFTSTTIPTGGIVLDGNYYLFYMEITGDGFSANGEWNVHKNRVMKSTDSGKTWSQFPNICWDNATAPNFMQVFPLEVGDYVYFYGLKGGRSGGVQCARVLKTNFEDMSKYEYFVQMNEDNTPKFVKGDAGLSALKKGNMSTLIIPPTCGEMSVMYNKYLKKFVATYQSGGNIVIRIANEPWGTFSSPTVLTTASEYSGLYGAFSHEMMTTNDGKRMYFLLSRWLPVYNVELLEVVFD